MDRPPSQPTPRVYSILLVEDNLDAVHSTCMLLRELGHAVDYAINGYVALDVARRFRPDVVLLAIGLPGANGFEVCRQIKSDPELGGARVIALTAYSEPEYRDRAKAAGFDDYFVKPLDPKRLTALFGDTRLVQPR